MEYYGNNDWRDYLKLQNELAHFGIAKRSGRYPWGSGENPYHHGSDAPGRRKRKIAKAVSLKFGKSKSPTIRGVGQYIHEHTNLDAMEDQDGMDVSLRGLIRAERQKAKREKLDKAIKEAMDNIEKQKAYEVIDEPSYEEDLSRYKSYDEYLDDYLKGWSPNKKEQDRRREIVTNSDNDLPMEKKALQNLQKAIDAPIDNVKSLDDDSKKVLTDYIDELDRFDGLSKRDFELKKQATQTLKENEIRNKVHSLYSLDEVEKLYKLGREWSDAYNYWYESKGTPEQHERAKREKDRLQEEMDKINRPKYEEFAKSIGVDPNENYTKNSDYAYEYFTQYGPSGDKYEVDGWVFELFKDKQRVDKR